MVGRTKSRMMVLWEVQCREVKDSEEVISPSITLDKC